MRTVYVSDDRNELRHLRERLGEVAVQSLRRDGGAQVDDWTIIGDTVAVKEKIDEYESRLGVTHLVAARLRVTGMSEVALKTSIAKVADIVT